MVFIVGLFSAIATATATALDTHTDLPFVDVRGDPASDTLLVLFPGGGGQPLGVFADDELNTLSEHASVQLVTYDPCGVARSVDRCDPKQTWEDFLNDGIDVARHVLDTYATAERHVVFMGYSSGCVIATRAAQTLHAERGSAFRLRAMVWLAPVHDYHAATRHHCDERLSERLAVPSWLLRSTLPVAALVPLRLAICGDACVQRTNLLLAPAVCRIVTSASPLWTVYQYLSQRVAIDGTYKDFRLPAPLNLTDIGAPRLLVIHGALDQVAPFGFFRSSYLERDDVSAQDVRVHIVDGASHVLLWEATDEIGDELRAYLAA